MNRRGGAWWGFVPWLGCATPQLPAASAEPPTGPTCPAAARELGDDPRLSGSDVLVVDKAARRLAHYEDGHLSTRDGRPGCWAVALAPDAPAGPKQVEGDRRTPEGWYLTSDKPTSRFPLAIRVHYPNEADTAAGLAAGRIDEATAATIRAALARGAVPPQTTALGGEILLHGGGASSDWTLGCVALETAELAALRDRLPPDRRVPIWLRP